MKVKSKKLSDTRVEISVTLDAEDLKVAREKAITRLSNEVKLEGFRKGKAPKELVEKVLDENRINSEAIDIAVRTTVPVAFAEVEKSPLVVPKVEVTKYVPNESAEYSATADVLPEVKLGDVVTVDSFSLGDKVAVTGISKGKGFAGTVKRWNFACIS